MANNQESEHALRRLVPPSPRVMVPIMYTNIFPDVLRPPSIQWDILKPSAPTPDPAPASDGPADAPGAASGGPAASPAPPAPGPAPPAAASPNDQSASAAASRHPLMHAPAPAVAHPNTNRSPSPAPSALTDISYDSMTSIESEEPTVPLTPQQRYWDINGTTPINSPPKAPTKANVKQLLKDLYSLRTTKEVDDKYTEFRTAIDAIAKRKLTPNTFTKQNAVKVQQLYDDLSKVFPWFSRCVDGWAARPYLLERQRNAMKRQMVKQEVQVGREAKKVLGGCVVIALISKQPRFSRARPAL
ncbi:hypothetical protein B0H13DRAFT_1896247 [Mycena leptocephala]|nr:hypothetical protein B0H13DRAFT_1896247 [Mycena leptocephala]